MATQPPPSYYGSIPAIATAYQNDPRNALNKSLLANATAGNPVAQGGWGVPDGLAHVAQSIVAALGQKQQDKKYATREHDYMDALKSSMGPGMSAGLPDTAPAGGIGGAVSDAGSAVASALAAPSGNPGAGAAPPPPGMAPPPMPASAPPSAISPPPAMMAPPGPSGGAGGLPPGALPPPPAMTNPGVGGMGHPPGPGAGMLPPGMGLSGGPAQAPVASLNAPPGVPPTGFTGGRQDPTNLAHAPRYTGEQIEQTVLSAIPGATVGSRQRSTEKQAELYAKYQRYLHGGPFAPVAAPPGHSMHELDLARDFNPPPGMPLRVFAGKVQQILPGAFVLTRGEGGHAHVADPRTGGTSAIAPGATRAGPTGPVIPVANQEPVQAALQMPTTRPDAPAIPDAVQSQRIAIARRMLSSNNPDLVAMAQTYLDKGLTEDHDAAVTHNAQEFDRGNLGYTSDLNDFNAARTAARGQAVDDRTNAIAHNFADRERVSGEQFTAGQSAAERAQALGIANMQQAGEDRRLGVSQAGELARTKLVIEGKHQDEAEKRSARLSQWAQTPTGSRQIATMNDQINANESTIGQLQQFQALNARNRTGGALGGGSNMLRSGQGAFNSDISLMNSIAAKTTLAQLGGSLGTAISDGDRNFIAGANISTTSPKERNDNVIAAATGALRRQNEFKQHFLDAQLSGDYASFQRDWNQYRNSVPLVLDKNGTPNPSPLSFDEWKTYRDAHAGKR